MLPAALWLALVNPAEAGIVNVFTPSVGAIEDGWHGTLTGGTTLLAGNEQKAGANTSAGLRVKHSSAHLSSLTGSAELAYALGEVVSDKSFANMRHRWQFAEPVSAFVFVQADHNALRALRIRDLAGAGLDTRIWRNEWTEAHLGVSMMAEHQVHLDGFVDDDAGIFARNSDYLTVAIKSDKVALASTTFFQPRVDDLSNWRALEELVFTVNIGKHLDWNAKAKLEHDNSPPVDIERMDLAVTSGLVVKF